MDQTYVIVQNVETGELMPVTKDQIPLLTRDGKIVVARNQEFGSLEEAASFIENDFYKSGESNAPVSGTPPLSDEAAITKYEADVAAGEQQVREQRSREVNSVANASVTPSSRLANQHSYNRYSMDNRDPTPFGDTPNRQAEKDFLGQQAFGGSGTGTAPGVSPTDWGLFEQDLMAGQVDPRRAVSEQLARQGLPTHANRGFLEDVYSNYGALRQMQNPGLTPEPVDLFNEQSQFSQDLFGMDGGSMNRVDTRGLWDNQFSDDYNTALSGQYSAASANGGNVGEQHQYEFNDINTNIAALAPFIGDQNAGYLMTLTQQAYDEYLNSPMRNQMTFATFLRDVKNAGEWY